MKDVEVTVYCLVYNHEKFLRDCLEGFVNHKTNFRFKVIVHDDASTDNSAEIIREYAEKYPEIIEPIYQTENQYSKGVGIVRNFIYPRMEGKYVAICEGDDFWNDENKLQKQYDALENNPDINFCLCRVCETNEEGELNGNEYPRNKELVEAGVIPSEVMVDILVEEGYQFQTSGYFFRINPYREYIESQEKYKIKSSIGDVQLILYYIYKGDFYFIDEVLSCYRRTGTNWSSEIVKNSEKRLKMMTELIEIYKNFNVYSGKKYNKKIEKKINIIKYGYVYYSLEAGLFNKVAGIRYWKYYDSKKELIYSLMKVYAPKLLKLIGKAD
ncbi:MAG: glycosyltransferase [Clostridia bacterium]|nr:glycosyltransferase [Clostridia bacterium]